METAKKRVLVALSGGVDSSVSAALLQKEGYAVEGAFIVTWTAPWLPCTWREERLDAMRVAAHLCIPFHTIDLSKEYERDVVEYMVREYRAGRTPNPDVMCNKYIKFGGLFEWAMARGFDYVATGHYARVREIPNPKSQAPNLALPASCDALYRLPPTIYHLLAGTDTAKDQSYFLWTLTQHHLAHTLFPVGVYEKAEVRKFAETFGLPTAQKKDSQGVCFLGKIDMKEFLQHYIPPQKGDVLDTEGRVIGTHDGAVFVTLGQRHGFAVTAQSPNTSPLYVIAKDVVANTVTVAPHTPAEAEESDTQCIKLLETNWIDTTLTTTYNLEPTTYHARLRYRQPLFSCTIKQIGNSTATIALDTPQAYVPSGQSFVLYDGEVCLGGGFIV